MNTQSPHCSVRRGGVGFGLVALLVVILIIGILFTIQTGGGKSYPQQIAETRRQGVEVAREISTQQLSILLAMYRQENNKLPKSPEDLENPGAFKDPWGNPLTFTFQESGGSTKVTYKSPGQDGIAGNEDDWKRTDTLPY